MRLIKLMLLLYLLIQNVACSNINQAPLLTATIATDGGSKKLYVVFQNKSASTLYVSEPWMTQNDVGTPYIFYAGDRTILILFGMLRQPQGIESPIGPFTHAAVIRPGEERRKEIRLNYPLHEINQYGSLFHAAEGRTDKQSAVYEANHLIVLWGYWEDRLIRQLSQKPETLRFEGKVPIVFLPGNLTIPTGELSPSDTSLGIGRQIVGRTGMLGDSLVMQDFEHFIASTLSLGTPIKIIVDNPVENPWSFSSLQQSGLPDRISSYSGKGDRIRDQFDAAFPVLLPEMSPRRMITDRTRAAKALSDM